MRSFRLLLLHSLSFVILLSDFVHAQTLIDALDGYPALSEFKSLLERNPNLVPLLTTEDISNSSSPNRLTVLVPSNTAFAAYRDMHDPDIAGLPSTELQAVLQYHILTTDTPAIDLVTASPQRRVIPTELRQEQYNNRTGGAELEKSSSGAGSGDGQVVIFNTMEENENDRKRQITGKLEVLSGLYKSVNLTILDGVWARGLFQMVDGFLTLPETCTSTMKTQSLTSLDRALVRANLGSTLDHLPNVTCIGPTNEAFEEAGGPDETASAEELTDALTFHTLTEPVYTNFLRDGQIFTTVSNDTVRVTVNDTGIYFNDAKLVKRNVI
ncbi:hypothetical protein AJ80_01535 [Polytolypa hystricis UAMH7299]|uniref:FAS1 domain-containing protein n=1 Tax=Polytolypa hystricis (strain UAMH7299) TaxID=1447883 RepID=A0A2B7Z0C5_POLH7|nr:hypothetical protein AJ80_01535 [Polytolypa hystricis UAMH7299]